MQAAAGLAFQDGAWRPQGTLRILSRRSDSEILILHGERRAIGEGERLAHIGWYATLENGQLMSAFCSAKLIEAEFVPDADGWHQFPVQHLRKLVTLGHTHLNIRSVVVGAGSERQAWTGERIARLGFLAGLGYTAKMIAEDPLIASTANNVNRQALRFGIHLSDGPRGTMTITLPIATSTFFARAAATLGIGRTEVFLRRYLIRIAARQTLEQLLEQDPPAELRREDRRPVLPLRNLLAQTSD